MADLHLMMTLAVYLESAAARRWQFGVHDCCTFMANWLTGNGYTDPMADRRGTYASRPEYRRMLKSEGGILASCSRRFAAIGLHETGSPKEGDVALVMVPFAMRRGRKLYTLSGALCTSAAQRAVVATDVGLAIAALPTVKAWSL